MEAEILKSELPSLQELLNEPICRGLIKQQIARMHTERANVLNKAKGSRFKSSAFSVLENAFLLDPDMFCIEYERIVNKRSTLPARERAFIKSVVNSALIETVNEMNKNGMVGGSKK